MAPGRNVETTGTTGTATACASRELTPSDVVQGPDNLLHVQLPPLSSQTGQSSEYENAMFIGLAAADFADSGLAFHAILAQLDASAPSEFRPIDTGPETWSAEYNQTSSHFWANAHIRLLEDHSAECTATPANSLGDEAVFQRAQSLDQLGAAFFARFKGTVVIHAVQPDDGGPKTTLGCLKLFFPVQIFGSPGWIIVLRVEGKDAEHEVFFLDSDQYDLANVLTGNSMICSDNAHTFLFTGQRSPVEEPQSSAQLNSVAMTLEELRDKFLEKYRETMVFRAFQNPGGSPDIISGTLQDLTHEIDQDVDNSILWRLSVSVKGEDETWTFDDNASGAMLASVVKGESRHFYDSHGNALFMGQRLPQNGPGATPGAT